MQSVYLERLKGSGLLMDGLCSFAELWYSRSDLDGGSWGEPVYELDEYKDQNFVLLSESELPAELKSWYDIVERFKINQGPFFTRPVCYPDGFYNELGWDHDKLSGEGYYRVFGRFGGDVNDDCGPYLAIKKGDNNIWSSYVSNYSETEWLPMKCPLDEFLVTQFLSTLYEEQKTVDIKTARSQDMASTHLFYGSREFARLYEDPEMMEHAIEVRGYSLWSQEPDFWYSPEFGLSLRRGKILYPT